MDNKRQWSVALGFVIALTIGAAITRKILGPINSFCLQSGSVISPTEGAIVQAIEMGIISLFGLLGIAIPLKMKSKEIFSLSWKALLVGMIIGIFIGWSYTSGAQSITCGYIY